MEQPTPFWPEPEALAGESDACLTVRSLRSSSLSSAMKQLLESPRLCACAVAHGKQGKPDGKAETPTLAQSREATGS